jgi:hypothetical protein
VLAPLADLLDGLREVVPYKAGDTTGGPCGKAGRHVTKTVNPLNWNTPERLAVYCETRGCSCSMKVSDLPPRFRVSEYEFAHAAKRAVRDLRAALGDPAATLAKVRADALREAAADIDASTGVRLELRRRADRIEAEAAQTGAGNA